MKGSCPLLWLVPGRETAGGCYKLGCKGLQPWQGRSAPRPETTALCNAQRHLLGAWRDALPYWSRGRDGLFSLLFFFYLFILCRIGETKFLKLKRPVNICQCKSSSSTCEVSLITSLKNVLSFAWEPFKEYKFYQLLSGTPEN